MACVAMWAILRYVQQGAQTFLWHALFSLEFETSLLLVDPVRCAPHRLESTTVWPDYGPTWAYSSELSAGSH